MISRRVFVASLTGGLLAAPLAAETQQAGKVPRIGYLGVNRPEEVRHLLDALRLGLRERG